MNQTIYRLLPLSLIGVLILKLDPSTVEYYRNTYMTKEEEQENIITKEIKSWSNFEYALREEESILFNKMLNECQKEEYTKAFNAKGEYNSTESLFMALIFQQQKMISKLIDKLSKYQVNQKITLTIRILLM